MTDFQATYDEAVKAAKAAAEAVGPENTMALNCGFGWATFTPATHPFVRWCRKNKIGDKHWSRGWLFWSPAKWPVQQVDHHYAGAKAFAAVLQKAFPEASVYADLRLD